MIRMLPIGKGNNQNLSPAHGSIYPIQRGTEAVVSLRQNESAKFQYTDQLKSVHIKNLVISNKASKFF